MLALSILSIKDDIEKIKIMDALNPQYNHLDIMDGKFVPSKVEMNEYTFLKNKLDVHLMVEDIEEYVETYSKLNPEFITFHQEATSDIPKIISIIRNKNIKVGISIKPNTEVKEIIPYLSDVDLVLIMSVEPGKGGQAFIESSVDKINELHSLRQEFGYDYLIEIDGGITEETAALLENCDLFVVGSYITLSEDYESRIEYFKKS
jgi:Pentose-5-phosphate-3-epimerase